VTFLQSGKDKKIIKKKRYMGAAVTEIDICTREKMSGQSIAVQERK
jgi:hypothetical protein